MLFAVLATALGVTICSKWFADRTARSATLERLTSTGKLCVNAPYPLTESVLTQIQELSTLKLAIVAEDSTRLISKSSAFPIDREQPWISRLASHANKLPQEPFFETIELGVGNRANATAFQLPQDSKTADAKRRYLILVESQSSANGGSVQAFVLPLVTGLFSSIAIALVAVIVANRIGHRIERLGEHVQKIADGSFETIALTGPIDAIYKLYESVNSMSQQLQRSSSQIAQNERSRMINLMASGLAHELRNHLTGARLAIQTCSPDPSTQEALSISLKQMKLAEETIQRLLTLKVDATEKMSAPMTILQIYESVRDMVQPIASHQRVLFQMKDCCGSDGAKIGGDCLETAVDDGSSIVGAIVNLVLNALEAAGPGGAVAVSAKLIGNSCKTMEWVVQDNGQGPTEEIVATMFEPFATTKREGVGLGLAMCRRIAQRHQGDVHWHREKGQTIFTMRIRTGHIVLPQQEER